MPMRDILEIAAALYVLALLGVGLVLAAAARQSPKDRPDDFIAKLKRSLASVGSLGKDSDLPHDAHRPRTTLPPSPGRGTRAANAASVSPVAVRAAWPGRAPRRRA